MRERKIGRAVKCALRYSGVHIYETSNFARRNKKEIKYMKKFTLKIREKINLKTKIKTKKIFIKTI